MYVGKVTWLHYFASVKHRWRQALSRVGILIPRFPTNNKLHSFLPSSLQYLQSQTLSHAHKHKFAFLNSPIDHRIFNMYRTAASRLRALKVSNHLSFPPLNPSPHSEILHAFTDSYMYVLLCPNASLSAMRMILFFRSDGCSVMTHVF